MKKTTYLCDICENEVSADFAKESHRNCRRSIILHDLKNIIITIDISTTEYCSTEYEIICGECLKKVDKILNKIGERYLK